MDEKQLQELQELRSFIEGVKMRYNKAKKVLDNIESLEIRYQKTSDSVEKILSETGEVKADILALSSLAKQSVEQIQEIRSGVSGYLDSTKITIETLQNISNGAATLKGQIDGGKGEIDALLDNARNLTQDVAKLKKRAEENLTSSDKLLVDFQKKAELMKNAFQEFSEIKKKIEDKNSGLDAVLKLVQQAHSDSESIILEIRESLKVSQSTEKEIVDIKERSGVFLSDISSSFDIVNAKKKQVEDVTGLVIDGSFAETFERRKKEIHKSLESDISSWKYIMLGGVTVLVLLNIGSRDLSGIEGFFTRLAYASPIIFLVLFSAIQYSKERMFLEKYAFKASSAAAVRNHIEFLNDKFESNEKVLDFSLNTFASIYSEPFKLEQDIKGVNNKSLIKKTSLGEGVDNLVGMIDKLYYMVPDEVIIKQVVSSLLKKKIK